MQELINNKDKTLNIINDNLSIDTHLGLFQWLQGDIQQYLPHEVLISVWGDFSLGLIYLDIIALHPLLRTQNISSETLTPTLVKIFDLWTSNANMPLIIDVEEGYIKLHDAIKDGLNESDESIASLPKMHSAVLHGIKDSRGSYDCLYILLSSNPIPIESKSKLAVFMPFIDCVFRRITLLNDNTSDADAELQLNDGRVLSKRECKIMGYVVKGASNDDIAEALEISKFTVKNHLQRIFKKLKVTNRSEAAYKYTNMLQNS